MQHTSPLPAGLSSCDDRYNEVPIRASRSMHAAAQRVARAHGVPLRMVVDAALAAYLLVLSSDPSGSSNSTDPHSLEKDGLSGGKTRKARAIDRLPPKARERK